MRLISLRISNLRNIEELHVEPAPGFNAFVGPNGAGKTSILEGAYLLSHAQSFRSGSNETLIRAGTAGFVLHARIERKAGDIQVGLSRQAGGWEAQINGTRMANVGVMLREFAIVCLEPGSHALISGGSVERRRFLDWGVFHVEPDYLPQMRQFRRALHQRNALLKRGADGAELDVWDAELARTAEPIAAKRQNYFERFAHELVAFLDAFLPELGTAAAQLTRGWTGDAPLIDALGQARRNDLARGHTTRGPHRADWSIRFERAPLREYLSRGQEKLCALACVLAQARVYANEWGEWPVIALDDLASELDHEHQRAVVKLLADVGAQVLVTGTELPESLRLPGVPVRMFHVEHGRLRSLL